MTPLVAMSPTAAAAHHSARVFDNLVTLCVLAASLAYCAAETPPRADLAVITFVTAGLAWLMRRGARARGVAAPNLPSALVNLLVLGAIIRAAWHVIRGGSTGNAVVSDLSEFLIVIQLIKLFDRKNPRDDVQLLALTLFVAIGSILTANSLIVGALVFVYTPLITGAAMALQIDVGLRRLAASAISRGAADGPGRAGDFRRTVVAAVIGSLVFAGLAFVLLPRGLGRNTLGAFGRVEPGSVVGFTDTIKLGQPGFLRSDDDTPVMDVAVYDGEERNIGEQMRSLHLRGSVSNTYNPVTRTWEQQAYSKDGPVLEPSATTEVSFGDEVSGAKLKQVVTMRGSGRTRYLFGMWRPSRLEWDAPVPVTVYPQTLVFERGGRSGQFRYTVTSVLEGAVAEDRPVWLAPTFATGRIHDLAVEVLRERKLPLDPAARRMDENRAAAAAMQAYLREIATYTLDMGEPLATGVNPIEHFIFTRKKGHCEYFASAMVAMCQSVGIPARLALGYLATEYNGVTGQFLVRASNAHAWAEVRIEPGRWVTFDPSPPADIEQLHAPATGVLARLRRAYDAIDFAWNSLVVSFDEQRRSSLLGTGIDLGDLRDKIGSLFKGVDERVKEVAKRVTGTDLRATWWTYIVLVGLATGIVWLTLRKPLMRALSRTRAEERAIGGSDPLAVDLHRQLLRALRRAHVPKPAPTPALSHAKSLEERDPALSGAAAAVADAVYGSRFAGRPVTRERWRVLKRELEAAAVQASAKASAQADLAGASPSKSG